MSQSTLCRLHSAAADCQLQIPFRRRAQSMWLRFRLPRSACYSRLPAARSSAILQCLTSSRPQHSTSIASCESRINVSELAGDESSIPQPSARNAGQSTSKTPASEQPVQPNTPQPPALTNGASQHPQPSTNHDMDQLKTDLQRLSSTVEAQAKALQAQMSALQDAKQLMDARAISTTLAETTQSSQTGWSRDIKPFEIQRNAIGDRRYLGGYDARFHSTNMGATPQDHRILPRRIILVRHAESEGNIDNFAYTYVPDPQVPLTLTGMAQAQQAGLKIKAAMDSDRQPYNLFFYTSPYKRSRQTYDSLRGAFDQSQLKGVQEEVQLREQDFGNFQDAEGKQREKAERLRFGRFFYRFPNGESGADVYDRMTIFEDHMIRDINAGRFRDNTSLVLLTHGLALRVFLMRWFHWTVDQFMSVYNPPNAEPLILERIPDVPASRSGGPVAWIHTKALYRLTQESRGIIQGCTDEMCSTSCLPQGTDAL